MARSFRVFLGLLLVALIATATPLAAADGKRVALVIGNADYAGLPVLANPRNDAEDVARALKGFGFDVEVKSDLDQAGLTGAMNAFAAAAKDADVALFYYAGHGIQIDLRNYLIPTDAVFASKEDVVTRSVPLDVLTAAAQGMEGSLLVFLDACQENPLNGPDGLARIPVARNQFVALAALPDKRAADGVGRNSPFSAAFLANAGIPGIDVSDVMLKVRLDVLAATGSQVPWDNSSLTQQIVFVPGEATALSPETQLWQAASSLSDPILLNHYLERFPDGPHAADAQLLLGSASAAVVPGDDATRSTEEATGGYGQGEEALWQVASTSRWRPLLESYVEHFPDGRHLQEARELMAILPHPESMEESPAYTCERLATHPYDETATFAGVSAARLKEHAGQAVEACRTAHGQFPDIHKYTTFLARALFVTGNTDEALTLFEAAAAVGNVRAIITLGALYEAGAGVPQDVVKAAQHYERAAAVGATDAAVNLARLLALGEGALSADLPRAIELLEQASAAGSKEAAFNLGALAARETGLPLSSAAGYFALASDRGFVKAHALAASVYDQAKYGARDPRLAAEYLFRAVATDDGSTLQNLTTKKLPLSRETVVELQRHLAELGYYNEAVDGLFGGQTLDALRTYRFAGVDPAQIASV